MRGKVVNIRIPSVFYFGEGEIKACSGNLNASTFCTLLSVYCILVRVLIEAFSRIIL